MPDYRSNLSEPQAVTRLLEARHIAVTTHSKPDGDAFGSVVALTAALEQAGKNAQAWLMPPVPQQFQRLRGWGRVRLYEGPATLGQPDLVVLVDTGAWSQIPAMREELSRLLDKTLIVDHHLTGDVPAAWRVIDGQAAACCEIIAQLIDQIQEQAGGSEGSGFFTPEVNEALFVGLASDTGWFRFSNTSSRSHELAGRLLKAGVDQAKLYSQLEQNERPQKLSLMIRALSSLRLVADNRGAVMVLRGEDFAETGAQLEETERFVDTPQTVASVQVVALITQVPGQSSSGDPANSATEPSDDEAPSTVRLSFRSKPGPDAVNVSQLAQHFGGGGHAKAAGAQVNAPLHRVIEQVTEAMTTAIHNGQR